MVNHIIHELNKGKRSHEWVAGEVIYEKRESTLLFAYKGKGLRIIEGDWFEDVTEKPIKIVIRNGGKFK